MLELKGVQVSYGAVEAVLGIDLTVGDGEVVALIGPNGAGKTSTLNAISGLVPYRGTITFDGAECRKLGVQGSGRWRQEPVLRGQLLASPGPERAASEPARPQRHSAQRERTTARA